MRDQAEKNYCILLVENMGEGYARQSGYKVCLLYTAVSSSLWFCILHHVFSTANYEPSWMNPCNQHFFPDFFLDS